MGMLNKRNAVLGWAAWKLGKRALKQKAKSATRVQDTKGPSKGMIAAALAAVGGAFVFWRKRREDDEDE